ncbi:DUF2510 domain-containing protein [Leifsonia sp. H3M29-4]|jgi:hypothetical protein|uniref:DUF2510 domain-containing protein n=1 Tax=Salinibacterium metalliresistens TaxID=3031321 RepID=UPI0023D9CCDE|nr:DUF2510 domain-containing protein [Salinibacterium metalliresistens]MDF1478631.1 DUF2510 domain-containing protein [Salinibacterium metalliresistens]
MSSHTDDAQLAPFGWYPDPADSAKVRWWDGTNWTQRTEFPHPDLQPTYGYSDDLSVTRQHDYV